MANESNSKAPSVETIDASPNRDRRGFLKTALVSSAAGLFATPLSNQANADESENNENLDKVGRHHVTLKTRMRAFSQSYEPRALPYKPSSLKGLSTRLIQSHWSNNYGGSVRALNETNRRLTEALAAPDLPAFTYNNLKREHLMRTGSVVLHELYFDNLGGNGVAPANIRSLLATSFGSADRWETEYRLIAAGLGGGCGWVMLGYNPHLGTLENYWMADHMHAPATVAPLLVIDLYEHSYQMDYGAAAGRYIDAFFRNINWEVVSTRIEGLG